VLSEQSLKIELLSILLVDKNRISAILSNICLERLSIKLIATVLNPSINCDRIVFAKFSSPTYDIIKIEKDTKGIIMIMSFVLIFK